MSMAIPAGVLNVVKTFNDLGVKVFGVPCTLFVPNNLTAVEPKDAYTAPLDITYRQYDNILVWLTWFEKDVHRLRKLGVFAEGETPSFARFANTPEVRIHSFIKLESKYIPESLDTDEFELVDVLMPNTYAEEIFRYYKIAPFRRKRT